MIQFKLYYDKDKETEFLNEMSERGYALTGFCMGFYHFDRCTPGEYIYQIDITEGMFRVNSDYREFMKEMDVEIVCLWGPWVILRKKTVDGAFVLYTDAESSIEHYTRIRKMFKNCAVIEAIFFCVELLCAMNGYAAGYVLGFVLAAILTVFIREIRRLDGILAQLNQRASADAAEAEDMGLKRRAPSLLLPLGLLLNGIALMIPETAAWFGVSYEVLKIICQLAAIALMLSGIVQTCRGLKK